MSAKRRGVMLAVLSFVVVIAAAAWFLVLRPVVVDAQGDLPAGFPDDAFDHSSFERLLEKYVQPNGSVDYEAWVADQESRTTLKSYLAAVARWSPENAPERFPEKSDRTAYWIYAYNALVIDSILERWPLKSVTDVKAPVEVVKGFGFFYRLKFTAGGEQLSLYEIEHEKVIAGAEDPRVHFVLNCGSGGCPRMRPELPTGDELEPFLAQSAADFVAEDRNVKIDHEKKTVTVSKIFDWYEEDFLNELRRRGKPTNHGVLGYLLLVATGQRGEELERAQGYRMVVKDYDWSVNQKVAQ